MQDDLIQHKLHFPQHFQFFVAIIDVKLTLINKSSPGDTILLIVATHWNYGYVFCWMQGQCQGPPPSSSSSLEPPLNSSCPLDTRLRLYSMQMLVICVKLLMLSKGSLLTFNFLDLFLLLVNLGLNLLLTEGPPVDGWASGCLLEKLLQAFRRNRGRLLNTALSYL